KDKIYTVEKMKKIFEKKYEIPNERQMEILKDKSSIRDYFAHELMWKCGYFYFARKVKTPTLVVKAKDTDAKLFKTESWEGMTKNCLQFHEIPGTHASILLPPYVDRLGEIILDYLDRI
ncbi:MAG: hypothetical protein ACQEXX_32255, partial [Bacillota bacterium]